MNHHEFSSCSLPSWTTCYSLDLSRLPEFTERLGELGVIYMQTRTDCGGIGKLCQIDPVYIDKESNVLFAPECGLMIPLDELQAVHATQNRDAAEGMYGFDFEFVCRPCGFTIYVLSTVSNMGYFSALIDEYFGEAFDRTGLDEWRKEFSPGDYHCENCEKAAEYRVSYPEKHPIFEIFHRLIAERVPVNARMVSANADLVSTIVPENIVTDSGIVSVIGSDASVIALNMRFLHALVVKTQNVEGSVCSVFEIYNSLGVKGFEFHVEEPRLIKEWTAICEKARLR